MRPYRASLIVAAIVAYLVGTVPAVEFHAADDKWIQLQTTNFTLYTNSSKRAALRIARDLEKFRKVLRLFYTRLPERSPVPSIVYLFKSDSSYTPFKPQYEGRPMEVGGYFQSHRDANYISMTAQSGSQALRVIYHEYIHQVLALQFPRVPVWFNEGLAEAYSTFTSDKKSASIGKTVGHHLITLRRRPLMPLSELLAITHESPDYNEGERRGIFYAESWALVHYLLWGSKTRKPQLGDYLERLGRGEDPDSAFRASFGVDPAKLEAELRMYVEQGRFFFIRVELEDREVVEINEPRVLGTEEVLFRLGDLLAHMYGDRSDEAERYFRGALDINPRYAKAHAGLGFLATYGSRYDEAVGHFEHALELDPRDPIISFQAASALLWRGAPGAVSENAAGERAPSDRQRAGELFRNTILHNPAFAEAYVGYGETIIYGGGDIKPAIKLLEAGWHLLPARTDLVVHLAVLYARDGQPDRARYLVDEVLPKMGDPGAVAKARSLLAAIRTPQPMSDRPPSGAVETVPDKESPSPDLPINPSGLDPDARLLFEKLRRQSRIHNEQVETFNQAVYLANGGSLPAAIEVLEKLLPTIQAPDLAVRTRTLLEQMKKDLERLRVK